MKLSEAIAVFDKSAERTTPNKQTEAWAVIRDELVALDAAPVAIILTKDVDGDWVLASDGVTGTLAEIDAMLGQRVRLVATSGGE